MEGSHVERQSGTPGAIGIVLVIVGIAALALRVVGADLVELIEGAGWPFYVIIPGLALLAAAVAAARPQGLGFAIPGAIVTTVGLILLYQQSTGHWESWAYAWALIPGASGLAMLVYGSAIRRRDLTTGGLRMVAIAAAMFVAGFWFFETTFETGRAPVDVGQWWPVAVIGIGLFIALTSSRRPSRQALPLTTTDLRDPRGDQP